MAVNVLIAWALAAINTPEFFPERQMTVTVTDWPLPPPTGWPPYAPATAGVPSESECVMLGASRAGTGVTSGGVNYLMHTRTAGLPWRTLVQGSCIEITHSTGEMKESRRWALGWLPLYPIWPGFALNTLFYSLLAWRLWYLLLAARRWRQRRPGCCVRCGYDLTGIAAEPPCPECGTLHRSRSD